MGKGGKLLLGIIIALVFTVIIIAFNSESCEGKGLKTTFSHFQLVLVGSVQSNIPIYKCIRDNNNE